VRHGAKLATGGNRIGNKGYFYEPTVLVDVPKEARAMNEEPFGPLALITPFGDFDDVVSEANRLPYGLAAYAFTRSAKTAQAIAAVARERHGDDQSRRARAAGSAVRRREGFGLWLGRRQRSDRGLSQHQIRLAIRRLIGTTVDIFERLNGAARRIGPVTSTIPSSAIGLRCFAAGQFPRLSRPGLSIPDPIRPRPRPWRSYKSRSLADMRAAHRGLAAILDVEMDLHVRLCAGWGISAQELETTPEHKATIAYTRFVLDCGMAGDLLDLHVALAPCVIGYAEMARNIVAGCGEVPAAHPYRQWIAEYAGEAYQAVAAAARQHLAELAERVMTEQRFPNYVQSSPKPAGSKPIFGRWRSMRAEVARRVALERRWPCC